jgi:hypothetical protein
LSYTLPDPSQGPALRRRPAAETVGGDFASIIIVEREPDFDSDLVMRHLAVFDMATRL